MARRDQRFRSTGEDPSTGFRAGYPSLYVLGRLRKAGGTVQGYGVGHATLASILPVTRAPLDEMLPSL